MKACSCCILSGYGYLRSNNVVIDTIYIGNITDIDTNIDTNIDIDIIY